MISQDSKFRACSQGDDDMDFVRGRKTWIGLAAALLIGGYVLHNLTTSHLVRYTCHGRYNFELDGSTYTENDAIFGISIQTYDTLLGKGAHINTVVMPTISDQSMTSTRLYIVKDGKDNPAISYDGIDMTTVTDRTSNDPNEGVMILISELTQTLHFTDRRDGGSAIQSFDGNCRQLN